MKPVEGLPFGLIVCHVNGRQVTVTGASDVRLKIRLSQKEKITSLQLHFLNFDTAGWTCVTPASRRVLRYYESRLGCEVLLSISDAAYKKEVLRVLNGYARYIRLKEAGDDESMANILTGCPAGGTVSVTFAGQKKALFRGPFAGTEWKGSLALSLDRQDSYERFLRLPLREFQNDFLSRSGLSEVPLLSGRADRVYIGNAYCVHLFPDNLAEIIDCAVSQEVNVTVVLPALRESRSAWRERILPLIEQSEADEIVVNDMGTLACLVHSSKRLALGTLLNRRRKDPRMKYKLGLHGREELLSENSLNDEEYVHLLSDMSVTRFEYEACGMPLRYARGKISLHLPFYVTNMSHGCIIASGCEGTDPGLGREDETCVCPCLERALLYPDELGLVGRYNSLFGLDREILTDGAYLSRALEGVDRVVAELL